MGLDQYAFFIKKEDKEKLKINEDNVTVSLKKEEDTLFDHDDFYWRKHPDLEYFMVKEYQSRIEEQGGYIDDFNCLFLPLNKETIATLRQQTKEMTLEKGEGFFWGESTPDDYKQTLEFCDLADKCLDEGGLPIYYSWW